MDDVQLSKAAEQGWLLDARAVAVGAGALDGGAPEGGSGDGSGDRPMQRAGIPGGIRDDIEAGVCLGQAACSEEEPWALKQEKQTSQLGRRKLPQLASTCSGATPRQTRLQQHESGSVARSKGSGGEMPATAACSTLHPGDEMERLVNENRALKAVLARQV